MGIFDRHKKTRQKPGRFDLDLIDQNKILFHLTLSDKMIFNMGELSRVAALMTYQSTGKIEKIDNKAR